MKIVVLKFGGTSVGSIERIKKVANIIIGYIKKRYKVIVVSSAMSGETNELIKNQKKYQKILILLSVMCFYQLENKHLVH